MPPPSHSEPDATLPVNTPQPLPGDWVWHSVPSTKYRRPRLHPDMVPREALLERLFNAAMQHRVSLVRAPGGYGKTTLLTQLAERCAAHGSARIVWLSLDEGENDLNRLLVLLLTALQEVSLHWDIAPRLLASHVQPSGPQRDATAAIIVNALQTHRAGRLLMVLDDLHCVTDEATQSFIASLADLLPGHVGLLLGSRSEPMLPLARWRVRGELATLSSDDLQFTAADAQRLVDRAQAEGMDPAALLNALVQSEGWAAGLQLILRSRQPDATRRGIAPGADKALFDYFASESLARLPDDVQDFLIQCSVLDEMAPALCQAITGRDDAQAVLQFLARSSLFLTAVDEVQPVLRFHDLFASFLRHKLAQRGDAVVRALHARAASVEQPMRSVRHWLAAGDWPRAASQIADLAVPLLGEGGVAVLMRWLASLPADFVAQSGDAQRTHAVAAAYRWDFAGATAHLEAAANLYEQRGPRISFLLCATFLPRVCHAAGLLDKGAALIARAESLPLTEEMRLVLDAARVWQALARHPQDCAPLLESIAARLQTQPAMLPDVIENLNVPHFYGMPGVLPAMQRLRLACQRQRAAGDSSWQLVAMAATVWPELWHGDRRQAEAAMAQATDLFEQLAVVPTTRFNDMGQQVFFANAVGNSAAAAAMQREICEQMNTISAGFAATWQRLIQFSLAQRLVAAGEHEELQRLWPLLRHPRHAVEYPVIDALRPRFEGHIAELAGDLDTAERHFEQAVALERQWRMPTLCGDARPALARLRLVRGNTAGAWNALSSLIEEMRVDDCLGPLLIESLSLRQALVALIPEDVRNQHGVQRLLERLAAWHEPADAPEAQAYAKEHAPAALEALSQREREVLQHLAAGKSNQQIADTLHISLHTVKRHVVNVLEKLGCSTRGQAAARWHAIQN